ncbi:MAG: Rpn family recombination-promoting nuclease/putative transposase [Tannerella sp.]|nr:Rpn family recombination-promoting nuclease/putative transposase [Tannerella sp.]
MNPRTDFGFKKIFENEDLLISFVNEMLPEKVVHIDYLSPEQLGLKAEDRKAVYDIYCKNENGKRFILEMQVTPQPHFVERSLFYMSHAILSQVPKGKVKRKNGKGKEMKVPWDYAIDGVYIIGILDFKLFPEECAADITVEYIQLVRKKAKIALADKFGMVTVELPKFRKEKAELSTVQDKWLYSLKNMERLSECPEEMNENIFKELYKKATINNLTVEEMKTYQKSILEYDDVILSMNYVEKMAEERGIGIGEERGIKKEQIKFVRNCRKHNMSVDQIAKLTGLRVEEIHAILTD